MGLNLISLTNPVSVLSMKSQQDVRVATEYAPPARCTHAAAHLQSIAYTPYACGAQRALHMNIHDRQAAARSGRWRRDCSRRHTLCSDLKSQIKRPRDLDL